MSRQTQIGQILPPFQSLFVSVQPVRPEVDRPPQQPGDQSDDPVGANPRIAGQDIGVVPFREGFPNRSALPDEFSAPAVNVMQVSPKTFQFPQIQQSDPAGGLFAGHKIVLRGRILVHPSVDARPVPGGDIEQTTDFHSIFATKIRRFFGRRATFFPESGRKSPPRASAAAMAR